MDRITISLCMIVKNEERYLEACLESASRHVDEIIIVDTGSTDSTVEIAKRFNAKIYDFEWIGDFAAARNCSIENATGDYILIMDADERVDEQADLQQELREKLDVYEVVIKNYMQGQIILAGNHVNLRLFKNHCGFRFEGAIHEQLVNHQMTTRPSRGRVDFVLHHLGYLKVVSKSKNKRQRNLDILKKAIEKEPTGFNYYNLGMEYRAEQQWEEAFHMFVKAFKEGQHLVIADAIVYEIGQCARNLGWYTDGIEILKVALPSFPHFTDLFFQLASLYVEHGYIKDAEMLFKKCLEMGDSKQGTFTLEGHGSYFAHLKLAEICLLTGRTMDAFEYALLALRGRKIPTALELYIRATMLVNVPAEDLYENVRQVYPLKDGQRKKDLVGALFALRHPMLEHVFTDLGFVVEESVLAVAKQTSGQYEEARAIWNQHDRIAGDMVGKDVILLAILLQDLDLLNRFKHDLNFNKREWKVLKQLVNREQPEPGKTELTADLEKLFVELVEYLIVLREDDVFEFLSVWLMQATVPTQVDMAKILDNYQLSNVAFDFLMNLLEVHPNHPDILRVSGDICYRHQQWQDALSFYTKLLEVQPENTSYERLYDLFERTGNPQQAKAIVREMAGKFPLSLWAEAKASESK